MDTTNARTATVASSKPIADRSTVGACAGSSGGTVTCAVAPGMGVLAGCAVRPPEGVDLAGVADTTGDGLPAGVAVLVGVGVGC